MEIILFRTEAIIDSNNLIHNLSYIKNQLDDNVLMMPVVKANGYLTMVMLKFVKSYLKIRLMVFV